MLTVEALVRIIKKPMGIIRIEANKLSFVEINEPLCNISGYSKEELMQMDPSRLLIKKYDTPPAVQLYRLPHGFFVKSETSVLSKCNIEVFFETEAYRVDDGNDKLLVVFINNISAKKWIEKQIAAQPILCSGIINHNYIIQHYDIYFDPIVRHQSKYMNISIFETIAAEQHELVRQALKEISDTRHTKQLILRTTKLDDQIELEMKITIHPLFDGFGNLQEIAFVISHLKPFDETEDPSVRLKIIMAQRNITAQWLSEATGITIQTISKLRNGKIKKPQQLTAKLIASELGVSVSDIWSETRRG
ncbi:XRE family transcriptional regulator [Paenibacillus sp. H1-7]|uniref:helix-turn-helix domain-containing protein n=1 Tax=Paenibacillus sp. H1-7 TaxID=2282849 RepID=UPI001EF8ABE3|nr:helix-turn-helix transcriptional regulator [Paenibacillus sp. H1-7]ULL18816.1 XRE family transcriptional regulator [Paenibacillus sp. H1-7]